MEKILEIRNKKMYNRLIEENDANEEKRRKNRMRMKRCVWRYIYMLI